MRTKLALLLALCRGAESAHPRRADLGLDPAMTEEALQALVTHVAGEEMTVFFSSHQIAEVDQIADHVAIIDRGRVVLAGALDDLRENFGASSWCRRRCAGCGVPRDGVARVRRKGRVLTVLASARARRSSTRRERSTRCPSTSSPSR